jgi:hypothetical protein
MVSDNNRTTSSLLLLVNTVFDAETGLLYGVAQDRSVLVVANTPEEDDRVWRKDILSTTSGVLGASTGNELRRVVVKEIFVDAEVLLFRQNGVVGFEVILCEKRFISKSLDICGRSVSLGEEQNHDANCKSPVLEYSEMC